MGPASGLTHLAGHLPDDWTLNWADALGGTVDPDMLLITDANWETVASALAQHPVAAVVVTVSGDTPARTVVDLLAAGAAGCVRIENHHSAAAITAAHLRVCHRRTSIGLALGSRSTTP